MLIPQNPKPNIVEVERARFFRALAMHGLLETSLTKLANEPASRLGLHRLYNFS